MGRIFMSGALSKLTPELDDVDVALEELLAPRSRRARGARDDQRRAGVQVQARAHPRGRVLGALEDGARRPALTPSPSGSASAPATSCSRSAPSTSIRRRASSRSSTAPPRPALREEAAADPHEGGPSRALARVVPQRAQAAAAGGRARADARAPLLAGRAALAPHRLPRRARRDGRGRLGRRACGRDHRSQGRALTALAEAVLLAPRRRCDGAPPRRAGHRRARRRAEPDVRFEPLWIAVAGRRVARRLPRVRALGEGRRSRPRARPTARISRRSSIHGLSTRT